MNWSCFGDQSSPHKRVLTPKLHVQQDETVTSRLSFRNRRSYWSHHIWLTLIKLDLVFRGMQLVLVLLGFSRFTDCCVFFFCSSCQFCGYSWLEGGGREDEMTGSCVLNEPRTRSSVDVLRGYSCKSMTVEVFVNLQETPVWGFLPAKEHKCGLWRWRCSVPSSSLKCSS